MFKYCSLQNRPVNLLTIVKNHNSLLEINLKSKPMHEKEVLGVGSVNKFKGLKTYYFAAVPFHVVELKDVSICNILLFIWNGVSSYFIQL